MRNVLIEFLVNLARINEEVWFLTGDLGFSFVEEFQKEFPERFINVGVAEQNMISVAAGLALQGKKVFVYSIINFCTFRCLEQIRNDVCYHKLDVTIIGVGTGYSYAKAAYSHHAIEDIGIMKMLPNLSIFSPADIVELKSVLRLVSMTSTPTYIRIDKSSSKRIHAQNYIKQVSLPIQIQTGKDVSIISYGSTLELAVETSILLRKKKITCSVFSVPKVYPIEEEGVHIMANHQGFFVIEEHVHSGLGSSISEILVKSKFRPIFDVFSLNSSPIEYAGTQQELREAQKLNPELISIRIQKAMKTSGLLV